ncbi:MAG TPA: hypothetical protein VKY89_16310 [Thermoanaerobaculia bacterium]|jgi:hypothetical protein|nr:hypothetical protein [Thermoanaerobaculia bacterium]
MRHPRITWFGAAALCALLAVLGGAAAPSSASSPIPPVCQTPQTPRDISPAAHALVCPSSRVSFNPLDPSRVLYIPRPGDPAQTLHLCGQHYHMPVENIQGPGQVTPRPQWLEPHVVPPLARVGAIVEIHTAYAAQVPNPCTDPEGTSCCGGQALVLAWTAHVIAGGSGPIPARPPGQASLSEWSGSTTGPDKPEEHGCKGPAQWSFALGDFRVGQHQLQVSFPQKGAQEARPLQTGANLSCDLTLIRGSK